jgi:hypothetical protein
MQTGDVGHCEGMERYLAWLRSGATHEKPEFQEEGHRLGRVSLGDVPELAASIRHVRLVLRVCQSGEEGTCRRGPPPA